MKATKPLPPWLQKAKGDGKDTKGAKPKGKPFVDGGNVKGAQNKATSPKASARNLPKGAGNAKGNVIHLKNGGKA